MPIRDYRCSACSSVTERIEVTTEDVTAPPPECCGAAMQRQCGSSSFADVTMRGNWVRFKSNKPPKEGDKHARGI